MKDGDAPAERASFAPPPCFNSIAWITVPVGMFFRGRLLPGLMSAEGPDSTMSPCFNLFGASRRDLLTGYQFACWQALSNCGVLRSMKLESLTALFLYLTSAKPDGDPASLSCMRS